MLPKNQLQAWAQFYKPVRNLNRTLMTIFLLGASLTLANAQETSRFELRSDPWINLHHFLYHSARNDILRDERLRGRPPIYPEDAEVIPDSEEAASWRQALEIYARYGARSLTFDEGMIRIKEMLVKGPKALPDGPDTEPIFRALRLAMPIYRAHWWDRHDAVNRARIIELEGLLARYEEAIADDLAARYESRWGNRSVLVDLGIYANWAGAYTTNAPEHIVMASADDHFPHMLGLEILFHEASHTLPLGLNIAPASQAAAEEFRIDEDRVWHSFIFYSAGEAVEAVAPDGYTPYADQYGLWDSGRMAAHFNAMDQSLDSDWPLADVFAAVHALRSQAGLEREN